MKRKKPKPPPEKKAPSKKRKKKLTAKQKKALVERLAEGRRRKEREKKKQRKRAAQIRRILQESYQDYYPFVHPTRLPYTPQLFRQERARTYPDPRTATDDELIRFVHYAPELERMRYR